MFSMITPVDPKIARLKSHLAGLRGRRTAPLSTRKRAEHYAAQIVASAHMDRVALLGSVAEGIIEFHPWAPRIQTFTPAQWRRLKKRHNRTRNRVTAAQLNSGIRDTVGFIQGATPAHTAIDETSQMIEILKNVGAPA